MTPQTRQHLQFSACGLNCGLCPNHYTQGASRCPGCGGASFFNPACAILACARRQGVEYCFDCGEYPCPRYREAGDYDSFITHQNLFRDNDRAKALGLAAYLEELEQKMALLRHLLQNYNDGRRKSFFCNALNRMDLPDLQQAAARLAAETNPDAPLKEKAALATRVLTEGAGARGLTLALRKRPKAPPKTEEDTHG